VATQIAFLGCTFVALGFITDGCYGLFASAIGGWLKRNSAYRWSGFGVAATVGAGDHRK
jgi:threonine/homoserine/homoserine lactone efflux protein